MKILFLIPYPLKESPSQRFRFEQYLEILKEAGHGVSLQSFLNAHDWRIFSQPGKFVRKLLLLMQGCLRRLFILRHVHRYDTIFIHREAAPFGPPIMEWLLAKVWRKRIVFDFDDAIWTTDRENESRIMKWLKARSKVASICRWCYRVSAGNAFLADFARQYNSRVSINPTTIDFKVHHIGDPKAKRHGVTIGWTGSHTTLPYLKPLESTLKKLIQKYPHTTVLVVADVPPALEIPNLEFVHWSIQSEVEDLSRLDIGIMPLPDNTWTRGKCGFKALQYMSLGIPAVVSPVGVNKDIIEDGVSGYLCRTPEEWYTRLETLLLDDSLRRSFGYRGREKVRLFYSVNSNASNFLSLFE